MDTKCYFSLVLDLRLTRGLSGVPNFMLLRHILSYTPLFVADSPDRRNNSAKNMAYFLE